MPGKSAPPPNQALRSGWFQSDSTKRHSSPPSLEWNNPPGIVPHQSSRPFADASSAQTRFKSHGTGVRRVGSMSSSPSAFGGYRGTGRSSHVAPPSNDRFSLTPKWPRSCAASTEPSAEESTIVTGSPRRYAPLIRHSFARRSTAKSPLRVPIKILSATSASGQRLKDVDL